MGFLAKLFGKKKRGVTNDEVMACARKKCKSCFGRGWILRNLVQDVCGCCVKGFIAKHGAQIEFQDDGSMAWKEG